MAGSELGKHSHRTGSPKTNKSDAINMKTEVSQRSNIHPDVPRDLDDDIEAILDFKLSTTTESSHTLDEMEQLLYIKLDLLYTKAHDQLLKSGYSKTEEESTILHAGSVHPSSAENVPSDLSLSSKKAASLLERIDFTVASLSHLRLIILILTDVVERKIKDDPVMKLQRVTVKPVKVPNIMSSDFLRSLNDDCSYGGCLIGCLESNSDDPKTAMIVDLVKNMRELHEKVEEQKEWAQKKVISSARKLSKDLLELKMLRTEEFDRELKKQERLYTEKTCMLMLIETEQGVHKIRNTAIILNNTMKRLARENAQMRADIEAIKLNAFEYENDFGEVLKRQRRFMRKVADVEKHASIFQSQFEEEKQRMALLEIELLRAEKELIEAEARHSTELISTYLYEHVCGIAFTLILFYWNPLLC